MSQAAQYRLVLNRFVGAYGDREPTGAQATHPLMELTVRRADRNG
jgi:hypothetical protein